jgi:hypothetical protein
MIAYKNGVFIAKLYHSHENEIDWRLRAVDLRTTPLWFNRSHEY